MSDSIVCGVYEVAENGSVTRLASGDSEQNPGEAQACCKVLGDSHYEHFVVANQ